MDARRVFLLLGCISMALLLAGGIALSAATTEAIAAKPKPLYPDLKTLKPDQLRFGTLLMNGERHYLLRFDNEVWNAGQGPLEVRADPFHTSSGLKAKAVQRIYDRKGNFKTTKPVGTFVYHPAHRHMHFGDFVEYQLWNRADYDEWERRGKDKQEERFEKKGSKNGVCMQDSRKVKALRGTPDRRVYRACSTTRQGVSVGYSDLYWANLADQWVDLGTSRLEDGAYVLRSIADPNNVLYESPNKRHAWRESRIKNAAVTYFTVEGGVIEVTPL